MFKVCRAATTRHACRRGCVSKYTRTQSKKKPRGFLGGEKVGVIDLYIYKYLPGLLFLEFQSLH